MKKQQKIGREQTELSVFHTCTTENQLFLGMHVNVPNFNYWSLLYFGTMCPYQRFNVVLLNFMWLTLKLFTRNPGLLDPGI